MAKITTGCVRDWRWYLLYEMLFLVVLLQTVVAIILLYNYQTSQSSNRKEYVSEEQRLLDYIGYYLDIRVFLHGQTVKIIMTNTGNQAITNITWAIYFNLLTKPMHSVFPQNASGVTILHSGGLLYVIKPEPSIYKSFEPLSNRNLTMQLQLNMDCRDFVCPRWYVAYEDLQPNIIRSTNTDDTSAFVDQLSPDRDRDQHQASSRFDRNAIHMQHADVSDSDVIPTLLDAEINIKDSFVNINDYVIVSVPKFQSEAHYLSEKIHLPLSLSYHQKKFIVLKDNKKDLTAEEYTINFNKQEQVVQIVANATAGAFYAVQTLLSILRQNSNANELLIPSEIRIRDKPRFKYRALMIDVARNFASKETILKLIEAMSMYKLNTLHLHLSDDEGWRIEIPGLEQLTQIGAHRCHDFQKRHCLHPSFGSGPYKSTAGSGFYTVHDYQEILRFAKRRHVTIIPEIDFPGHSRAAMEAMIQKSGIDKKEDSLLHEIGDKSEYYSLYAYPIGTVNICIHSTFYFMEKLIASFKRIHENIQPINRFHLGGDEVAQSSWQRSKACENMRKMNNNTDIRTLFLTKALHLYEKYNMEMQQWEDGVMPSKANGIKPYDLKVLKSKTKYSGNIHTNAWDNLAASRKVSRAYVFANAGYKVIMSGATHLYLDHRYETHFNENGLTWATQFIDTKKMFFYLPMDLYENEEQHVPEAERYKLLKPENIVGIQASLFSELVRNPDRLFYMTFPRILALAERAWHEAPWENMTDPSEKEKAKSHDWSRFSSILGQKEFKRLDMLNVPYRIPPPGVKITGDTLIVNVGFPGLDVEVSMDNGKSWMPLRKSEKQNGELTVILTHYGDILLRTLSADRKRNSAVITIHRPPPVKKN